METSRGNVGANANCVETVRIVRIVEFVGNVKIVNAYKRRSALNNH